MMRSGALWLILASLVVPVALPAETGYGESLSLGPDFSQQELSHHLVVLSDVVTAEDFGQVSLPENRWKFASLPPEGLILEASPHPLWLAGEWENVSARPLDLVLELGDWGLSVVRLYYLTPAGWQTAQTGLTTDDNGPVLQARYPAFPLSLAAGEKARFFLEIRAPLTAVHLPIRLFSQAAYQTERLWSEGALAGLAGALGLLVVFGVSLFLWWRGWWAAFYSLFVLGVLGLFLVFSGYVRLIWSNEAQIWALTWSPWLISGSAASFVILTLHYFGLKIFPAVWQRAAWALAAVVLVGPLALFWLPFSSQNWLMGGLASLVAAGGVVLGLRLALRRVSALGWWYALGAALQVLAGLLWAARALGWVPNHPITTGGFFLAGLLELVLLAEGGSWVLVTERRQLRRQLALTEADLTQAREALALHEREDGLTGLLNRRYLLELLGREFTRFKRYAHPFSLLLVDLDHFRQVNDTYGYAVGDQVLKRVAGLLTEVTRTADILGRSGGEEFLILLPETAGAQAIIVAEKIRNVVKMEGFEADGRRFHVAVSLGLVQALVRHQTPTDLLRDVDEALYKAKESGRDRAILNLG